MTGYAYGEEAHRQIGRVVRRELRRIRNPQQDRGRYNGGRTPITVIVLDEITTQIGRSDAEILKPTSKSVEMLTITGTVTGSESFNLTHDFSGATTGSLTPSTPATEIEDALELLVSIDPGDVEVYGYPGRWLFVWNDSSKAGLTYSGTPVATVEDIDVEPSGVFRSCGPQRANADNVISAGNWCTGWYHPKRGYLLISECREYDGPEGEDGSRSRDSIGSEAGAFLITGSDATLTINTATLIADPGSFTITGTDATLSVAAVPGGGAP